MHRDSGSPSSRAAPACPRTWGGWGAKALLLVFLLAAFLGLKVGQLGDTGVHRSSSARNAAVHLVRRLEEGSEVITEVGGARRATDLFILRPGGKVYLPGSIDSQGRLRSVSKARIRPAAISSDGVASAVLRLPGHVRHEAAPLSVAQGPEPEELTGLSAARAARASALSSVPSGFDWHTYLLYHPELRSYGITTEDAAREHYVRQGRAEGRLYKRVRVLMRYTAGTGLINQHYSHIAAVALAVTLGAELVLPPGVKRDSFAHYFSQQKEQNEVTWTPTPLEALLDVDQVIESWRLRGLTMHRTPLLLPFPDLTEPATAFPLYPQPNIDTRRIVRIEVFLQNLDMAELVERVRAAVVARAAQLLRKEPDTPVDYLVVDFPCTFFMLRTLSSLPTVTEVTWSLTFAPAVRALADRVVAGMTGGAGGGALARREYNAAHLRLEKDAHDWSAIMGGQAVVWRNYIQAMRQAGFSKGVGVYVASGLLTYGASQEMADIIKTLTEAGLCSEVYYKEQYLPAAEIEALSSEQKALLDFLVLARGRRFVGFGSSTFSFFLREYRALGGLPRAASLLADASVIGTDPIFISAGTVV